MDIGRTARNFLILQISFIWRKQEAVVARTSCLLLGYTQIHILKYIYPINIEEEQSLEEKEEQNPFLWTFNPAEREEVLLLNKSLAFSPCPVLK